MKLQTFISLILAIPLVLILNGKPAAAKGHLKAVAHTKVAFVSTKPAIAPPSPSPAQIAPASYINGCNNYESTFAQYDWNVNVAMAICEAESSGNVTALSATGDRGIMQINYIHADMVGGNLDALYDPYTNIAVAYRLYVANGWNPWNTYKDGAYLTYL